MKYKYNSFVREMKLDLNTHTLKSLKECNGYFFLKCFGTSLL